jgi:hypothetical protein
MAGKYDTFLKLISQFCAKKKMHNGVILWQVNFHYRNAYML